jgi:hypothetical protein
MDKTGLEIAAAFVTEKPWYATSKVDSQQKFNRILAVFVINMPFDCEKGKNLPLREKIRR